MTRTPFVIYGAGGHAREMRDVVDACIADGAAWELAGWVSDHAVAGEALDGLPVAPWDAWREHRPHVLIAIGTPQVRRRVAQQLSVDGVAFPAVVHPGVHRGRRVTIGTGVQAAAGCALTADVVVGDFVLLNRGVQVSHDDVIGPYVTLNPLVSLSGNVHVGEGANFGTGVVAIPGVRVGAWSVVGAGTVLIRDVADNAVVVGNPGREVKRRSPGWFGE